MGDCDIIGQRLSRILDNSDGVALGSKDAVDSLPTRAINEPSVHDDDVTDAVGTLTLFGIDRHGESP
jgi:hypothetical protein